jgi:hypothetical protein
MTMGPAFSQSRVQGYSPHVTSFSPGQVQDAAQHHAVTQGQSTVTLNASRQHERFERKTVRDKERKHADRANDDQAYMRVCELLEIDQTPKNTLSQRSECECIHRVRVIERFIVLERVESNEPDYESICELLDISMRPRDTLPHRSKCSCILLVEVIKHFIVQVAVQEVVARQSLEGALRHQLAKTEAYARNLRAMLAKFSTGADVNFCLPADIDFDRAASVFPDIFFDGEGDISSNAPAILGNSDSCLQ